MADPSADRRGWPIRIFINGVKMFSDGMVDPTDGTVGYSGSGKSVRLTLDKARNSVDRSK